MDELQQLHGELDVRHRTASEFEVELWVLAGRDAFAFDSSLHPPDFAHVVVGERLPVHEPVRERAEPGTESGITGDEARLGEGLPLPGEAPLLVVRGEAADGSCERPLVALWSESSVDPERLSFHGGGADLLHQLGGDVFCLMEGVGVVTFVHEHHVDVRRIGQFRAAQAAHPDHRERKPGSEEMRARPRGMPRRAR